MIEFRNVSKFYNTPRGRKVLLRNFSMVVPAGAKVALMGRNGAGKSTMIGMISGTVSPNSGRILRAGTMSWPMGFSGSFAADISGRQNALFVARIYGVDATALLAFVEEFSELGSFFDMPVGSYSSGMKARLAFGLSMGLGFDWYLVDEVTAVGDTAFRKKSLAVFKERLSDAGLIMVSHSTKTLRDYCTSGIVLEGGECLYFPDLDEAIRQHEMNMDNVFAATDEGSAVETLYQEARRRYQNGDYARAEEFLSRALAEDASNPAWHALLGYVNRRLDMPAAAADAFGRALALQNEPRYRVALAQALAAAGRFDEAESAFQEVLAIDPDNGAAHYALGGYLYKRGQVDEAEQHMLRVLAGNPDNPGAHRTLALINDARGDQAAALVHHAAGVRLLPDNPAFLLGYARSQASNADPAGARATYQRLLSIDPENQAARADLERLA